MKERMGMLWGALLTVMPSVALAEGAGGGYRGIASMYFTLITVVLIFGAYDVIGPMPWRKKAMLVIAPVIAIGMYLLLPTE